MRTLNLIILPLVAFVAVACGYGSFGAMGKEDFPADGTLPNADLAVLREHYYGTPKVLTDDLVFEGYVVSDDRDGNFFRSFVIDDGTAALEIRAGLYDLYTLYPRGRRVVVHARGAALGMYNGVMQLGACVNDYAAYRVEEFGTCVLLDGHVSRDTVFSTVEPVAVCMAELDESMCGRLVRMGPLAAVGDEDAIWGAGDGYSSYGKVDFAGRGNDSIAVVTSIYASFADEKVCRDSVMITGILMYGNFGGKERFAVKLRDTDDVEMF